MASTFYKHVMKSARARGWDLKKLARDTEEYREAHSSDDPSARGHSTFWKHYAASIEAKAARQVRLAKVMPRQAERKSRRYAGYDYEAERRQHEARLADMRLAHLAQMAREIDASPEGKALQVEAVRQEALQSAQQVVQRHDQQRQAQLNKANALANQSRVRW